jgi:uncharacterized protein (DUF983 family)
MVFSRCLRSRCPVCGEGRLFAELSRLRRVRDFFLPLDHCEKCQFQFARQPGYYMGVLTPILPLLALICGVIFAGLSYFGFGQEVDTVLVWGAFGIAFGLVVFFRAAIAIYIALDHMIDPPGERGQDLRR